MSVWGCSQADACQQQRVQIRGSQTGATDVHADQMTLFSRSNGTFFASGDLIFLNSGRIWPLQSRIYGTLIPKWKN